MLVFKQNKEGNVCLQMYIQILLISQKKVSSFTTINFAKIIALLMYDLHVQRTSLRGSILVQQHSENIRKSDVCLIVTLTIVNTIECMDEHTPFLHNAVLLQLQSWLVLWHFRRRY